MSGHQPKEVATLSHTDNSPGGAPIEPPPSYISYRVVEKPRPGRGRRHRSDASNARPSSRVRLVQHADAPRIGPTLRRAMGILALALVTGTLVGLSVPRSGRTGWSQLARLDLPRFHWPVFARYTPRVYVAREDSPLVRGRYLSDRPLQISLARPLALYGVLAPGNYDAPQPDPLLDTPGPRLPSLTSGLSRNALRHRQVWGLRPAEFAPVADAAYVPFVTYHDVVAGEKDVWFDVEAAEFEAQLDQIAAAGATPISLRQWWNYATRGDSLPPKPIVLTFDDGYESIYTEIWPRLAKRGWPAVYCIVTGTVGRQVNVKPKVTWDQLREMAASGLCDFVSHSVNHPILTNVSMDEVRRELAESKATLERELKAPMQFFSYPEGKYNQRIIAAVEDAGYVAALAYTPGASSVAKTPFEVMRYTDTQLDYALRRADASWLREAPYSADAQIADLAPGESRNYGPIEIRQRDLKVGRQTIPMTWITGGVPITVHADYRYAVGDVAAVVGAPAGINGSFFQLAHLRDISNAMLGPVMSQLTTTRDSDRWRREQLAVPASIQDYNQYIPGAPHDVVRLVGRPYVLIGRSQIKVVPFAENLNSLAAAQQIVPDVTDAFVGGGWLVRDGHPLTKEEMDQVATRDHDDTRRRAWFAIDRHGAPMIGACPSSQRSTTVAEALVKCGAYQAVLLDSGFSSSLIFQDNIYVTGHSDRQPSRPVPHMILLKGAVNEDTAASVEAPAAHQLGNDPGAARAGSRRRR